MTAARTRVSRAWAIYRDCRERWPELWRRNALRIAWRESGLDA